MIDSGNYVSHVLRTDSPITPGLLARLQNPETVRLLHAAMGMATEAAELLDMLKKHLFYGRPLDLVNAAEEVGDSQWYAGLAVDVLGTTMNEILTMNIAKLRLRYPEKFDELAAVNRDVDAERRLLEVGPVSRRGTNWLRFSAEVFDHIENYTVPQYGDEGEDQVTEWTADDCLQANRKYAARFRRGARQGEQHRDFLKMSHYVSLTAEKYKEEGGK